MKKIVLIIVIFLLCACGTKNADNEPEYVKLMKNNDYLIIDVRTKEEYKEGHIKDSINIPYDEINEDSNIDKNKLIFVYCKSGMRSKNAYNTLKNMGYNVYDLGAFDNILLPKE